MNHCARDIVIALPTLVIVGLVWYTRRAEPRFVEAPPARPRRKRSRAERRRPAGSAGPGSTAFCTNCGHRLSAQDRFCVRCGAPAIKSTPEGAMDYDLD